MTRDDILKLDAGPELDRLVAEKVMGLDYGTRHSATAWIEFEPSTDIASAWEVWDTCLGRFGADAFAGYVMEAVGDTISRIIRNLTPLTICRAALLATLEK